MNNYRLHQLIASVCVAIFIMSGALCLLVRNRSVYERTNKEYRETLEEISVESDELDKPLTEFEASLNYNQLADEFTSFFGKDYKLMGYDISKENIDALKQLKVYYRWAWVFVIASLVVGTKSFIVLSKRRLYMPLLYGGGIAAVFTTLFTVIMARAEDGMAGHIRRMVFERDYSFFTGQDVLIKVIPPEFANRLLLVYILIVFILIVAMALIRGIIIYCGRPHRF